MVSKRLRKSPTRVTLEPTPVRRDRAAQVLARLTKAYPEAGCTLDFGSPYQLLVATILAAQCTDQMVNRVTPALFERFPDAAALAAARLPTLERLIRPTGFFRNKAKSLKNCASALFERHDGRVPATMGELSSLPGVGRKTANVVLGVAFGAPALIVDTHLKRVTSRLALHAEDDPEKIEAELCSFLPEAEWTDFSNAILFHGRRVCASRKPRCPECCAYDLCPWPEKTR